MGRLVLHWVCVCALVALPVGGCSEETTAAGGTGGSGDTGGDGGTGGMGGDDGTGGMGGMPECESPDDCDDSNECTGSACGSGMCEFPPVADGTACDEDNECSVGMCAEGICPPVSDNTVCGDDAGTCQQGSCRVACDEQGIRDAIAAGGGPYTFDCDGPQTVVTEAEIVIDNDVALDGEGNLTVDGGGEHVDRLDNHRVFFVTEGVTAELHGFTVTRGVVSSSSEQDGGGILNEGTMTVTNSTVSGNSGGTKGGGMWNSGTLTLTNSTVSGNSGGTKGGGIGNSGTLTLTNSTVSGNDAGNGGGIGNSGTMTVTNSTVSGNAGAGIGGIWNEAGTMTVTNSTVSGNESFGFGCDGSVADGIANDGTLTLTNSTVSGNNGCGRGIVNFGTLRLTHSTLVSDSEFDDRFIENRSDEMTVTKTVVVGTCLGVRHANGYNIESPGRTCGFDQKTDLFNINEEELSLGPLQDNGGPTETHALLPGSVAIDAIPADMCEVDEDQRGFPRDSMCDVGAFEVQP